MEINNILESLVGKSNQFAQLMRRMMHFYHKDSEGPMMHPGQGRLLLLILKREPVGQKELVELLDIRPSSLSELLKKLEAKGLISRAAEQSDKRNMVVSLTPEGRKLAEQAAGSREDVEAKLFAALTEEECAQLDTLLAKLVGSWQETLEEAGEEELEFPRPPHHGPGPHHGPAGPHPGMRPDFRGRQREWQDGCPSQPLQRPQGWQW